MAINLVQPIIKARTQEVQEKAEAAGKVRIVGSIETGQELLQRFENG